MTRLQGRDAGDLLKKEGVETKDVLLNTNYKKLKQFENFWIFAGVEDLPIVKLAIELLRNEGRNKAFAGADFLTQLAAFTAGEAKPKAGGYGSDEGLYDGFEG